MPSLPSSSSVVVALLAAASMLTGSASGQARPPRYTAETPDLTIDAHKARAIAGPTDGDRVAALAVIAQVGDRAAQGAALKAIRDAIAGMPEKSDVRGDAAALARSLEADEGTPAGADKAKTEAGILSDVAVLGPFRDTGGGLDAHDGPETKKTAAAFGDPKEVYSWGTVEVRWRPLPPTFTQARGVPLDLFVAPRKESCTWIASKITLDAKRSIVVRLAAAGTARLVFDGTDLDKSDDVHETMRFDRLAAKVEATAGPHIVAAKVCTGALDDSGRVRLRVTDDKGAPLPKLTASADLAPKSGETLPWSTSAKDKERVKFTKVVTPLVQTASGKGGGDALLNAAIVRSIAGGDDEKSPRAPGQLDAYLQNQALDPDRLAIAAWITESAVNKSARLYRARAAAVKANDATTIAFVDRRLVEQHLDSETPDWAIASFRGAGLDKKQDGEALWLSGHIAKALRVESLHLRAGRDLTAAFKANRSQVPLAILFELASIARSTDATTWVETTEELSRRGTRGEVLVDAMGSRTRADVEAAAKDAFAGGMDDADEALSVAHHVVEAGGHELAAQLYRTIALWAPNRAEAWAGLARELATVSSDARDQQTVLVALRRARELAPGDAKYRAELAMRLGKPGQGPSAAAQSAEARDDERYLVKSETILARRKGVPAGPPDVADRELHWLRAVRMHPDNRVSQLIQYGREIVIPPRTQGELFEMIPSEGDVIEILKARVHRKDGAIAFPVEEHNDGNRPRIRWPELEAGDTVEVAVREWTSTAVGGRGDAPFYFMDYAGSPASHPLLYNEVIVETSPGHPLYVDVLNDKLAPYKKIEKDDKERNVHVVQLIWDKPLVVPEEPLAPHTSEVAPVIVGSTFKTWADFRKWYGEAIRGFTEPDDEVRRLAAELTKGKKTRDEKLRALFDFVADDIRYVNYVSGEWWLPNRPQQLLARREGDCDDKAILLITLLRSIGIEAQEVMVQTRMTGQPSLLLGKNAAIPLFDHGIAYLPGQNGQPGMYLDATSPQSRLGPIPSMDARAVALRMDAGPAEIVTLPASSPDEHGADVTWTVNVAADGSGELTGEERHSGDSAFWLRTNIGEAQARAQYVENNLVEPWFPTIDLDKKIDFEGNLKNGEALVKYKAKSRGMARRENKDLVLPLSPAATYGSQIAPLPTRTLPVLLPAYFAPNHQNRTLRAIAPQGMAWSELPPGGDANGGEFGKAHLEIARDPKDPRAIVIKRSVSFNQHLIPVDKYPAWRAWVQQVDALMHKEVRLVEAK
ncbi:MAG: transglutaminase domain-containing protein [Labilithrix sp.]|nr:transglutaminase domain-containing protein [Labilithrix sp.]MCW5812395.1 transglutaminase domain-containing protein [Labilithrix sp.]